MAVNAEEGEEDGDPGHEHALGTEFGEHAEYAGGKSGEEAHFDDAGQDRDIRAAAGTIEIGICLKDGAKK